MSQLKLMPVISYALFALIIFLLYKNIIYVRKIPALIWNHSNYPVNEYKANKIIYWGKLTFLALIYRCS